MSFFEAALLSYLLTYGYGTLFVSVYFSSLVVPLPVSSLLLAMGAFSSQGFFNVYLALAITIIANILGDLTGFYLARRYGPKVLRISGIRSPRWVTLIETYIRSYPGTTILFSRFTGTTDILGNIFAGLSGLPLTTFLFWDIVGNIISDSPIILTGFLFGDNWQAILPLVAIGGSILIVVVLIVWVVRLILRG